MEWGRPGAGGGFCSSAWSKTNTISVGGFGGLVNQSVALNDGEFEVLFDPHAQDAGGPDQHYQLHVSEGRSPTSTSTSLRPGDPHGVGCAGGLGAGRRVRRQRTEVEIVNLQKKIRIQRRNDELM